MLVGPSYLYYIPLLGEPRRHAIARFITAQWRATRHQ